jgi:hypothetical protein
MLKNYLKVAWRNITRSKGFTFTNLLSLTVGITCTIFIFLWIQDELTYDKFHKNYGNIYQVLANRDFNNQVFTDRNMVMPAGCRTAKKRSANKKCRCHHATAAARVCLQRYQTEKGNALCQRTLLRPVYLEISKGQSGNGITDPSSIVLTQSAATSFSVTKTRSTKCCGWMMTEM